VIRQTAAIVFVCAWVIAAPSAQSGGAAPAARVLGTEISSELWYQRSTDTTVAAETALFGREPFRVTFTITYQGLQPTGAPSSVEVLLAREPLPDGTPDAAAPATPAVVVIDGLKVPLLRQTHPSADTITATLAFEDFEWMVSGTALEFEAFGRMLVLVPSQVTILHTTAVEWAQTRPR
jgi:hypothetical protein